MDKNILCVCHNAKWDSKVIVWNLKDEGMNFKLPSKKHWACTMELYTNICKLPFHISGKYKFPKLLCGSDNFLSKEIAFL